MFEVEIGVDGLGNSHKEVFPEMIKCVHCGKDAYSALTATEFVGAGGVTAGEEFVSMTKPTNIKGIWPDDIISTTIYICLGCGGASALWNQR